MSEEVQIPMGTLLAYSKVKAEFEGVKLECNKLSAFLYNSKFISKEMEELMKVQLKEMTDYHGTLGARISLFEKENPTIKSYKDNSKGFEIIGDFNPNDNPQIAEIKNRSKQLINCIDAFGLDPRRNAIAITKIEEAQMMAVKSLFH